MSNTFDGFDLDKVAALIKTVSGLETSATTLSSGIGTVNYQADSYLNTGYGISPQLTRANPYTTSSSDPDRVGLQTVAQASPGVAAEIKRRLAHLTACQKISNDGYPIDPDVVFDDEAPPSEAKIKDALSKVPGYLDKWYDGVSDDNLITTLSGLNAAEVDAVIGSLSDADLQKMGMAVSLKDTPNIAGIPYGMSDSQRVALANALLPKLGHDQLSRMTTFVGLQPPIDIDGVKDVTWTPVTNGLYGSNGSASIDDINQGQAGDCWFLAAIGAELQKNPDFVNQHIKTNDNGTYTVTFYRDGKPVEITVDNTVPTQNNGNSTAFSHPTGQWNTDGPSWVEIYEKAYAQMNGSYHAIEGGFGSDGMTSLTGTSSDKSDPGEVSISEMQQKWNEGHPITVGSKDHTTGHLWWTDHQEYFDVDSQKMVSLHEYTVVGFGTADDHPGEVKLRNPWGDTTNATEYVWVSQDELNDNFNEVSVGND